jgi:hypothetical protein
MIVGSLLDTYRRPLEPSHPLWIFNCKFDQPFSGPDSMMRCHQGTLTIEEKKITFLSGEMLLGYTLLQADELAGADQASPPG